MRAIALALVAAALGCGGDDAGSGEDLMQVETGSSAGGEAGGVPQCEPLPMRCEQACFDANQAALGSCDLAGWLATLPMEVTTALMSCILGCDSDSTDDMTCVGMGTAADCDCQEQCYADNLDAAQIEGAQAFADCYEAAIASACG